MHTNIYKQYIIHAYVVMFYCAHVCMQCKCVRVCGTYAHNGVVRCPGCVTALECPGHPTQSIPDQKASSPAQERRSAGQQLVSAQEKAHVVF